MWVDGHVRGLGRPGGPHGATPVVVGAPPPHGRGRAVLAAPASVPARPSPTRPASAQQCPPCSPRPGAPPPPARTRGRPAAAPAPAATAPARGRPAPRRTAPAGPPPAPPAPARSRAARSAPTSAAPLAPVVVDGLRVAGQPRRQRRPAAGQRRLRRLERHPDDGLRPARARRTGGTRSAGPPGRTAAPPRPGSSRPARAAQLRRQRRRQPHQALRGRLLAGPEARGGAQPLQARQRRAVGDRPAQRGVGALCLLRERCSLRMHYMLRMRCMLHEHCTLRTRRKFPRAATPRPPGTPPAPAPARSSGTSGRCGSAAAGPAAPAPGPAARSRPGRPCMGRGRRGPQKKVGCGVECLVCCLVCCLWLFCSCFVDWVLGCFVELGVGCLLAVCWATWPLDWLFFCVGLVLIAWRFGGW